MRKPSDTTKDSLKKNDSPELQPDDEPEVKQQVEVRLSKTQEAPKIMFALKSKLLDQVQGKLN